VSDNHPARSYHFRCLTNGESTLAFTMFQYFVSLVPTTYTDALTGSSLKTYQYYVTDHRRTLGHEANAGIPGIFIKYDFEAVSVDIAEERNFTFAHFLVRLCGIIGGRLCCLLCPQFRELTVITRRRIRRCLCLGGLGFLVYRQFACLDNPVVARTATLVNF